MLKMPQIPASVWSAIISDQTAGIIRKAKQIVNGFRTPSWFRAKRNVELKQAKAKISGPKPGKQKRNK
jgi:hypothetical protein